MMIDFGLIAVHPHGDYRWRLVFETCFMLIYDLEALERNADSMVRGEYARMYRGGPLLYIDGIIPGGSWGWS